MPLIGSCSTLGFGSREDDLSPEKSPVLEYDNKLGNPVFSALPPEARGYLQRLAAAFEDQDKTFLLAQGEAMFEKIVRPQYDDEDYLAMLYRIESYAGDSPFAPEVGPKMYISKISHVEYTGWEPGDPVMEIRGKLFYKDKRSVPCRIMLVWKLDDPRIIGWYP